MDSIMTLTHADIMQQPPSQALTLSTRPKTVLDHHQITTLGELLRYTPTRLLQLQGCGAVCVLEIRQALQSQYGLDLKPEPPDEG